MTSQLSIEEFKERLSKLTYLGDPSVMGTPFAMLMFNSSSKPFLGELDGDQFKLTRNSIFPPTGYLIKGTHKPSENKTQVVYEIKFIPFGYYWIRIFPALCLILINLILIKLLPEFRLDIYVIFNVCILLMAAAAIGFDRLTKWRLESIFRSEFKIVN